MFIYCFIYSLFIYFYNKKGGLFNEDEKEQELIFKHAVEKINSDQTILPRSSLVAHIERVRPEDSFRANKKGILMYKKI